MAIQTDTQRTDLKPVVVFTATTFLSALLLFSIQPMFAKMVLPVLGGSPSVWAVAMCFFQGALLAGYCYAHVLNRYLGRHAATVHILLGASALIALPIGLPSSWGEPPPGDPYFWQLGLFALGVGLPFVAVAANAPLLQAWFATTGHPSAKNPYFLYAASNLGSFIALLGYPLLLEPALGLRALAWVWTFGFVLLLLAIALCALTAGFWTGKWQAIEAAVDGSTLEAAPSWTQRAGWVVLALVPSALLTAFTTHVATDVASAPLIWVIPLSLYLLTFVIVFRDRALISPTLLLILHLVALAFALVQLSQTRHDGWFISAAAGFAAFLTSALVAHRTLYETRPAPRHLTEFYLWMSLGGGLGGLLAGLIAPQIFSEVFEYPILLALTMACRPGALKFDRSSSEWMRIWLIAAAGILAMFWVPWAIERLPLSADVADTIPRMLATARATLDRWGHAALICTVLALLLPLAWWHPPRQLVIGLLMGAAVVTMPSGVRQGEAQRSFFGVYRVTTSFDKEFNILKHGTTLHGAQRVRDTEGALVVDTTPATYYYPQSPMGQTVEFVRASVEARGAKVRVGVIGLGTGSLACYAKDGEAWRFFEIDPVVVGIAKNAENFSFLHFCQPKPDVVIGDARLTMAKQDDGYFDLIIVDAFSSDAVPVHLMTAEALRMYAAKLSPTGVVLLHISNRYLDLDNVLAATLPLVPDLDGILMSDDNADGSYASSTSTVAVFSKSHEALEVFRATAESKEFETTKLKPWTDDTSDILGPFLSKLK
jgi:spermidine synthase